MKRFILSLIPTSLYLHIKRLIYKIRHEGQFNRLQEKRTAVTDTYSFKPFDDTHSIFIHIPKCAGVSVCQTLYGNLAGGHTPLSDYIRAFEPECIRDYFIFTIVRNPWDRLISGFSFLREEVKPQKWHAAEYREKVIKEFSQYEDFEDFVKRWVSKENIWKYRHFWPQWYFIYDSKIEPDFIGRYETLNEDFRYIAYQLGKSYILPETNRSHHRDYREYYTDETRDIVGDVYRRDIELLGYRFDGDRLR